LLQTTSATRLSDIKSDLVFLVVRYNTSPYSTESSLDRAMYFSVPDAPETPSNPEYRSHLSFACKPQRSKPNARKLPIFTASNLVSLSLPPLPLGGLWRVSCSSTLRLYYLAPPRLVISELAILSTSLPSLSPRHHRLSCTTPISALPQRTVSAAHTSLAQVVSSQRHLCSNGFIAASKTDQATIP
jgi:hypothetical protein